MIVAIYPRSGHGEKLLAQLWQLHYISALDKCKTNLVYTLEMLAILKMSYDMYLIELLIKIYPL